MKSRLPFAVALVLLLSSIANAQTAQLQYEYQAPLATVNTYTQQILIDGTQLGTAPTCVATSATLTTCTVAAPALATGSHNVRINATLGLVTASTIINGLGGTTAPVNPGQVKVVITVTIGTP